MIFIDSDAYIGLSVKKDLHHNKAKQLLSQLTRETFVTSWQVIDEVTTKLSLFTTRKKATDFLESVVKSDTQIEFVNTSLVRPIKKLFNSQTSKKISLTDCANMAIARSLGIDTFFSFDKHYQQNGFKLLKLQ